ncbi:MAG TPA: baseplate J/gp47 family protein [Anaerolineae bacterium]|nr:baseplate J/gp47 family protein [Anaerolineae bacterium]
MNDQVITLDKNDDILQVHSKIEWSDGRRVILVVPRGCKALDAEHELKLLRRWADEYDVQVALVSNDYYVKEYAATAGLPVFSSVPRASSAEWRWQREPGEPAVQRSTPLDEDAPRPRKPLLDRLGLVGWRLLVTVFLFAVAVAVLGGLASILVPSATITIHPAALVISDTSEVILDPTVTTIDHINAIVPAVNLRKEMSGTVTVNTTKTATAPADHASGVVTFNNLQGTEATIPLGTIVATTSGNTQRYSTTITATLPAGFNAHVNVPVRALKPGPEGNANALQINFIEGPLSAVARVVNLSAVGGGTIKDVNIVSFDDRQAAREKMSGELKRKALGVLQSGAEDNVYIVPASVQVIVLGETFDHLVDDPSDTLTLKTDAVASGIYADFHDLETFAQRRLLSKMPQGYTMLPGTLRVDADPNARAEANSVILKVRSALLATPVIDQNRLLDGLNDMPVADAARKLAARVKLAEPPEIKITPSWWSRMPFFRFRTTLFVVPQK